MLRRWVGATMKPAGMTWKLYLREGLCNRMMTLGERFDIPWLIYNPLLFKRFHELAQRDAPAVMRAFAAVFPDARRYVDVGSGSGAYAAEAMRQGRRVIACEHARAGRRMALRQGVDCREFDLQRTPPADLEGAFDLAYCFEVAEHIPEALGQRLVAFISQLAPQVVFTAAQPQQGGQGHINEQPKEYWIERFANCGLTISPALSLAVAGRFRAEGVIAPWLIDNVIVLERAS